MKANADGIQMLIFGTKKWTIIQIRVMNLLIYHVSNAFTDQNINQDMNYEFLLLVNNSLNMTTCCHIHGV